MSQLHALKGASSLHQIATLLNFQPKFLAYILYKKPPLTQYSSFHIPKRSDAALYINTPPPAPLSVLCWIAGCVILQPQTAAPIHDTQMTLHFQRISLIFRLTSPDKLLAKFTNGKRATTSRGLSPRRDLQSTQQRRACNIEIRARLSRGWL